jgi:hypothetical protein
MSGMLVTLVDGPERGYSESMVASVSEFFPHKASKMGILWRNERNYCKKTQLYIGK